MICDCTNWFEGLNEVEVPREAGTTSPEDEVKVDVRVDDEVEIEVFY